MTQIKSLMILVFVVGLHAVGPHVARADSPPNITTDIPWSAGTGGVAAIESAFNNARRQEEVQLGLENGRLGNLDLPSQAEWDSKSDDQKALFLINAERTARAGMQANVIALPLTGIHPNLDAISQNYAQFLIDNNAFSHTADGKTPTQRFDEDPILASCREFLTRAENLAAFFTSGTSILLAIERSIYNWLYADAGSAWGHREAVLLQDKDLNGNPWGYDNNAGSPLDEGYLGIARASGNGYQGWNYGEVVVMNVIDPGPEDCPLPSCPADFNSDNQVNVTDIQAIAAQWGKKSSDPDWNNIQQFDLDEDNRITIKDIMMVAAAFGPCS